VPGWTDEHDWGGLLPFEDLPHTYNPASGLVSSANNKTAGNDYPYYISQWFDLPFRIDRIREMLAEKEKLSVDDFRRMQADFKSKLVMALKEKLIREMKKADDLNEIEKSSLGLLTAWDGTLTKQSPAASIFEAFYGAFIENVFADEMGEDLFSEFFEASMLPRFAVDNIWNKGSSDWCDDVTTPDIKETFTDMVQKSFKDAVAQLQEAYGHNPEKWEWGKIHRLTLKHPMGGVKILDFLFDFNRGPFGVGGSSHTVCPYTYRYPHPERVFHGASQRHIYSTANWDESLSVIPAGSAGIPASRHYCDQTKLYIKNEYHHDYFSRSLVEKNAKYKMVITGKRPLENH